MGLLLYLAVPIVDPSLGLLPARELHTIRAWPGLCRARSSSHSAIRASKGVVVVIQQGQVFRLRSRAGEKPLWAYRYRVGGRGSQRVQRGGFALEKLRRESGVGRRLTLAEFVDEYLAQHEARR
jgi:hypothetical protein